MRERPRLLLPGQHVLFDHDHPLYPIASNDGAHHGPRDAVYCGQTHSFRTFGGTLGRSVCTSFKDYFSMAQPVYYTYLIAHTPSSRNLSQFANIRVFSNEALLRVYSST